MATDQPNVLLIMADDVGWFDEGSYHRGMMDTSGLARVASAAARSGDGA